MGVLDQISFAERGKIQRETQRRIESRAEGFARALTSWLQRMAVREAAIAAKEIKTRAGRERLAKAAADDKLEAELRRLMQAYGLREMATGAGMAAATTRQPPPLLRPSAVDDFLASHEPRLQRIIAETRVAARLSVRDLIRNALKEQPVPGVGEITRRIRAQFHGEAGGVLDGMARDPSRSVLPTTLAGTDEGVLYAFSGQRARLIARTEMRIASSTGAVKGYEAMGVKRIEWIAITRDRRSGDREHWKMDGEEVEIGEDFTLPDGTKMKHPGDPSAPVGHLANCRCSIAPVV